jgi:Secretion system C-terminal sorting domain
MKRKILSTLLAALMFTCTFSQNTSCDTFKYDNPADWPWTITNYITSSCASYLPLPSSFPTGTISVGGGRVNFTNVRGAHENRILKNLGRTFDQNFELNFDLNIARSQNAPAGIMPVALTSDFWPEQTFVTPITACNVFSNMDEIAVYCVSDVSFPYNNLRLGVQILDNGTRTVPASTITINYNVTNYVTLRVYSNGSGRLFVYSNPARTVLIGQTLCFTIPKTVKGLTFLQHSALSGAGYIRTTNGWVDNTQICEKEKPCCKIKLNGPTVICNPTGAYTYTLTGDVSNPVFSVAAPANGVTFTQSGNTVTITNWGPITTAPKIVQLVVTSVCECNRITDTLNIYVHPVLNTNFNIFNLGSSGSDLTDFQAISTYAMPGTYRYWSIFNSNASASELSLARPVEWYSGATASTFNVYHILSGYPNLTVGNFYLIKHVMGFNNGLCGTRQSYRLIYISANFRMIDLGEIREGVTVNAESMKKLVRDLENIKPGFAIYPNPTTGIINVQHPSNVKTLELFDMVGNGLLTVSASSKGNTEIDLAGIPAGIYILRADGKIVQKIVKQ